MCRSRDHSLRGHIEEPTCLAIGENANAVAIKGRLNHRRHHLEYVCLLGIWGKHLIEGEPVLGDIRIGWKKNPN